MKTILVTGSNRGLGLEFVRQFSRNGDCVVATCRQPDQATALHAIQQDNPETVHVLRLDVADPRQIGELSARLGTITDIIDLLINNAGVFPPNSLASVSPDEMEQAFQINAVAPFLLTRELVPFLEKSNPALVANISSLLGSVDSGAGPGRWAEYAYGPSKAALNRIVRQLALDLKPRGIIVIAQYPGWVRTDMGGSEAPLSPSESVSKMRRSFAELTLSDTGRILEVDGKDAPT
jgi:NAD(P)-dependent dehydrogenase (short-subunit alcohol dehydrogenase family)